MVSRHDFVWHLRTAVLCAAGLTLLLTGCQRDAGVRPERTLARLRAGETVRMVAFGDSVTRGYGVDHPWPEALAATLRRAYPQAGIEVRNAGIDGNTAADGLARLERDVLTAAPDLVLIAFGLNDLKLRRSPPALQHDLEQIVARVEGAGAEAMLLTTNPVRAGLYGTALGGYNDAIRELAKRRNLPLVDVAAAWQDALDDEPIEALLIDIAHPSERGQQVTAAAVYALLSAP